MESIAFGHGQRSSVAAHLAAAHLFAQADLPAVWSAEVCTLNQARRAHLTLHLVEEDTLSGIRQWAEFLGGQVETEQWTGDAIRAYVDAAYMGVPVRVWTVLHEAPRAAVIRGDARDRTQDRAAQAAAEAFTPPAADPAALAPDGITRAWLPLPDEPPMPSMPPMGTVRSGQ